jgi:NAD(P)-dependent dehydrogenase (short-subunit alcohol dehydrogenase family)
MTPLGEAVKPPRCERGRTHAEGPGSINAGVFNLMRHISLLYGPEGVTLHTVSPGPAGTPRLRRVVTKVAEERGEPFEEVWQTYLDQNSLGRLPTIDEVAWAIEMLLASKADAMHGAVLYIDARGHKGIG